MDSPNDNSNFAQAVYENEFTVVEATCIRNRDQLHHAHNCNSFHVTYPCRVIIKQRAYSRSPDLIEFTLCHSLNKSWQHEALMRERRLQASQSCFHILIIYAGPNTAKGDLHERPITRNELS